MTHPLFPEHDPDDPREIGFIRVFRQDRDGARNAVPATFGPDELTGIDQLFEAWGGGRYEVVAHEPNGRVLARQRYAFEGPSKPLAGATGGTPTPTIEQSKIQGGGDQWTALMGIMQMFMQMQQAQSQQQTQLVLALLNKGDTNANAHVQSMTQLYSQFGQTQTELLKQALSARAESSGGADPTAAFIQGLKFAEEHLQNSEGGDALESLAESAMEFLAGMKAAQGGTVKPEPEAQS